MAEIDPVVVQLRADLAKYRADMLSTATRVDTALANQQRSVQRLETQIRSSSSAIATAFASVGAAFAGAFSAQALANLADSYTRLQNSLKVAGLEGQALADVQAELVALSGRNGVAVEGLANLYGNIAQVSRELGISQAEIVAVTQAAAESLRITGTSAQAASGAILGLQQALASGTVRAEEFNQINEGGLRPLLQAAANTERFAGSVAALRTAVNDGKVSSQEFYQGILANAAGITDQASKATLTLSGSMEALRSQFVVFIGQADQSLGVTAALTNGLKLLGENIDVVAQALAVIASIMGIRLVAAAGSATAAFVITSGAMAGTAAQMGAVGAASFALQARLAGAASSATALAFAARGAGATLLAAFGGPIGATILALGGALAYAITGMNDLAASVDAAAGSLDQAKQAFEEARERAEGAGVAVATMADQTDVASSSLGQIVGFALRAARGLDTYAASARGAAIASANLRMIEAREEARRLEVQLGQRNALGARNGFADFVNEDILGLPSRDALQAAINSRRAEERLARETIGLLVRTPENAFPSGRGGGASADSGSNRRARSSRASRSGPSPEEIQARFANELFSLAQQTLSARRQLATTAEEEAEFQLRSVELARRQALGQIEAEKDYSAAQRQRLTDQVEALADAEIAAIERDRANRLEQEANDLREAELRGITDALRARLDLADNAAARQRLALEIFDLEEQERQAILARTAANEALDSAIRQRAAAELAAAQASAGQRRDAVGQGNETPAQRFMREINRSSAAINEDLDAIAIDGLNNLNDGITDAIMNAEGLGDVFKKVANQIIADLIRIAVQQAIIQPLANSLFGGGGGFGSIFGGLFGRASGGYVAPKQMVRVNEGAARGRVEGFMPTGSGKIVPLGQMNAMASGGGEAGGVVQVQVTLSEDLNARIDNRATNVAVAVTRQSAPTIIGAARDATMRELGRDRL